MKFTNNHELPDYLERWLKFDDYDYVEGAISATGLIAPVRAAVLKKLFFDKIEIDLSDMIARRLGTAIHNSFETIPMPDITKEQRVLTKVNGQMISGKYDMLKKLDDELSRLIDIKTTSVWNAIYGSSLEHWKLQLSIYRYILQHRGWTLIDGEFVKRKAQRIDRHAEVCLVFTDWKRSEAKTNPTYPKIRVGSIPMDLFGNKFIENYIIERLNLIEEASKLPLDELPYCTDEELWIKAPKFAVKKEGNKRASKVCNTLEEAKEEVKKLGDKYEIEERKSLAGACNYCDARSVCSQCKMLAASGMLEGAEE